MLHRSLENARPVGSDAIKILFFLFLFVFCASAACLGLLHPSVPSHLHSMLVCGFIRRAPHWGLRIWLGLLVFLFSMLTQQPLSLDCTNNKVSLSISVGSVSLSWAPLQSAHPGRHWAVGRPRGRRRHREQTSVATFLPHCPAAC